MLGVQKMKKSEFLKRSLVFFAAAMTAFSLVACKKDEEGKKNEDDYTGTWKYDELSHWLERPNGEIYGLSIHNMVHGKCTLCGYALPNNEDPDLEPDHSGEGPDPNAPVVEEQGYLFTEIRDEEGEEVLGYSIAPTKSLKSESNIEIPETYKEKPILEIVGGAFNGFSSVKSVKIPPTVTEIGYQAFYRCTSLKSIEIPEAVTYLGDSAFFGCTSLAEITLSPNIERILYKTFEKCTSLKKIVLPEKMIEIGRYAFENCTSLQEIEVGANAAIFGWSAFANCNSLKAVYIEDLDAWCRIEFHTAAGNPLNFAHKLYLKSTMSEVTEVKFPSDVEKVGNCAFQGCSSLKKVTIPDTVKEVGFQAFTDCSSLEEVVISSSLTKTSPMMFTNCRSLKSVTLPDNITLVDRSTFEGCTSLTTVNMGKISRVEYMAFSKCDSLQQVTFKGTKADWENVIQVKLWNINTDDFRLVCTDGEITIKKIT